MLYRTNQYNDISKIHQGESFRNNVEKLSTLKKNTAVNPSAKINERVRNEPLLIN